MLTATFLSAALLLPTVLGQAATHVRRTGELRATALSVAPHASVAAIGWSDGLLQLVHLAKETTLREWPTEGGSIARLSWNSRGSHLATATFRPQQHTAIAPNAASQYIDSQVTWSVFELVDREPLIVRHEGNQGPLGPGCALSPDAKLLLTWTERSGISLWDVPARSRRARCFPDKAGVRTVLWSPKGHEFYVGDLAGYVSAWSAKDGSLRCIRRPGAGQIDSLAVQADGKTLAVGGGPAFVALLDVAELEPRWKRWHDSALLLPKDRFVSLAFDPSGECLVGGSNSYGITIAWSVADGTPLWSHDFNGGNHDVLHTLYSPDGERVAVWGLGMRSVPRIFDARTGATVKPLERHNIQRGAGSLAWTSDGAFLVARTDRGVIVLDGNTFEFLRTIER